MNAFIAFINGILTGIAMSRDIVKCYERQRKQRLRKMSRDKEESLYISMSKSKNIEHNNTTMSRDIELSEAFDRFWKVFPKREGSNPKRPARLKFFRRAKFDKIDPAAIILGAERYAEECKKLKTHPRYVAMAQTWLNQYRWEDTSSQSENVMSVEEFRKKMKEYEERKERERAERRRRL